MLPLWQILLLAVVQGIAEFLPISSSGHLVLLASLFAETGDAGEFDIAELNIVLHIGTLLSIVVVYWKTLLKLLKEHSRVIPMIILGTVPAIIIGLPLRILAKEILESALLAGCMLIITGILLLLVGKLAHGERDLDRVSWLDALIIGCSQAFALLPGISRSGTTICCGMSLGLRPTTAATFSFLLALPAIAGAGVLEIYSLSKEPTVGTPIWQLVVGAAVSFVVGLVSLMLLLKVLGSGKLGWFALWCIPVGLVVIGWQLLA